MHAVYCNVFMCIRTYLLWDLSLLPWTFRGLPYCVLFVLFKLYRRFLHITHRLRTQAHADSQQGQFHFTGHKAVCPVPESLDKPACVSLHVQDPSTHILRASNSVDIGINTASSCKGPTCFVPELIAGIASVSMT